jgi:PAS domain S-box-containing protein
VVVGAASQALGVSIMAERSQIFDASANVLGVALADTAPDFVCFATSRGDPFYLNAAGRDLIGLKENQDISAMSLCDFYVEQSWAELCQVAVPEVNQVGRWTGRSRLRRAASGEPIDVRTIILRIKPSETKPTFMAIIHVKVDELDQLKTTLAEVQARKSAILESSLDAIITIDHNGVITEFNRAAERIFGHPREKVLGTKPSDVLFPPNEIIEQQDRIDRYLTIGEGSLLGRRTEVAAMRAGGEAFPAEIAMTLGHEQGEPVLTFFVRDISRR